MTTKAQAYAEQVEANKRAAYMRKVASLTGQAIYDRQVVRAGASAAYAAGQSADDYAAAVAYREPVGAVVHPMKAQAVEDARARAQKVIDRVWNNLAENGWDLEKVAPYPSYRQNLSREQRAAASAKYSLYHSLTTSDRATRRPGEPNTCTMSEQGMDRFLNAAAEMAAAQYDAFVVKLVHKVGEIASATLEGSHVWGCSFLRVVRADGSQETWKTQQIVNCSVLGNAYYQWPTRKVKA